MHIEIDLRQREVRNVICLKLGMVVFPRILLRQKERLCRPTLVVDRREIKPCVHAVLPFRREHEPVAVGTPVVVAFSLLAVAFRQRPGAVRPQVHHPQVGITLGYREVAPRSHGVHQPPPVIARTDKDVAAVVASAVEKGIHLGAESAGGGIERYRADRAFYLFIFSRQVQLR